MRELADLISRMSLTPISVTARDDPLPFPPRADTTAFDTIVGPVQTTALEEGIRETVERSAALRQTIEPFRQSEE